MNEPERLVVHIRRVAQEIGGHIRLMEVCGTHTHVIGRAGLRVLMPPNVELISGPGCPVCVTSQADIERMLVLAQRPSVVACTYGDMMRVPGLTSSLERLRASGANVTVVSSALGALDLARRRTSHDIIFMAVGFETTAPGTAVVVRNAAEEDLPNFFVFPLHKSIVPAMEALVREGAAIDGFLTPGHVSVIIGSEAYTPLALRYSVPCVATGFEPLDILEGIHMLLLRVRDKSAGSYVQYGRAIRPNGNQRARDVLASVFDTADAEWRGLGIIPNSGFGLKREFARFHPKCRYELPDVTAAEPAGCRCGEVLRGVMAPAACPLFGRGCTPRNPIGPCMVSSEGSCAARYRYG